MIEEVGVQTIFNGARCYVEVGLNDGGSGRADQFVWWRKCVYRPVGVLEEVGM